MRKRSRIVYMAVVLALALTIILPMPREASALARSGANMFKIYGLVNKPLEFTYTQLQAFPMVSEVAELKCVDGYPDVVGNWTGIPLFYLLTLAQISSHAYKIVTIGSDGYQSDLLVEDALKPTTILALKDNGTTNANPNIGPLPRLIVPNNWGYKWVDEVDAIQVVSTNYNGTYESQGYPDNATRPGMTVLPSITPPIKELNFALGNLTFNTEAFTDASISAHTLNYPQKKISLNVTVPSGGAAGFADFALPQDFLKSPYIVTIDNQASSITEADIANQAYIYISLPEGFHTVNVIGAWIFGFAPEININRPQNIYVGQKASFNASGSVDYATIISYKWSFGDGTNGTGVVVSHSYNKEGTYQLALNVTDSDGRSSSETFTITVGSPPQYIPLAIDVLLVTVLSLLLLMFGVLVRNRRKERRPQ